MGILRIDVFLKLSRLAPRRPVAQKLCEAGAISLNGVPAKSAREVHPGDLITIRSGDRITTVRVTEVPSKAPSKAKAATLYTLVAEEVVPLI
jgi:ribosomal 50S subunit-recycling heat shock protein